MDEQEAAAKLKARMGEWKQYSEQATPSIAPSPTAPTAETNPTPFAWAEAPTSSAQGGERTNPDGSLVSRLVKYEEQIAELQAELDKNKPITATAVPVTSRENGHSTKPSPRANSINVSAKNRDAKPDRMVIYLIGVGCLAVLAAVIIIMRMLG